MNKVPHVHAALIKAWADGAKIQYLLLGRNTYEEDGWLDLDSPSWNTKNTYRIKPECVYPKSTLTFEEIYDLMWPIEPPTLVRTVYHNREHYAPNFQSIVDAAVKRYIQETEGKV